MGWCVHGARLWADADVFSSQFLAGTGEGRRPTCRVHAAAGRAPGLPAVRHGHRCRPGKPKAKLGIHRQLV